MLNSAGYLPIEYLFFTLPFMKLEVFTVTAYRFGMREKHSYVVGVFSKKAKAIKCADDHTAYRGRKYGCDVDVCKLDHYSEKDLEHTDVIYHSKSFSE